jgi:hypothetical protein
MRASLSQPVRAPLGCGSSPPAMPVDRKLDGVYRATVTREQQAKRYGIPPSHAIAENYGKFTLVVDGGRFAVTQENDDACTWQYGRARLSGEKLQWTFTDGGGIAPNNAENKPGERFLWRWSLYRDTLTLRAIEPSDIGTARWHRVGSEPSRRYLSRRCPPPKAALPR